MMSSPHLVGCWRSGIISGNPEEGGRVRAGCSVQPLTGKKPQLGLRIWALNDAGRGHSRQTLSVLFFLFSGHQFVIFVVEVKIFYLQGCCEDL
jgi:hypothetical protein